MGSSLALHTTPKTAHSKPYQEQFERKAEKLQSMLAAYDAPRISYFASPEINYRQRAEFRIWHSGSSASYAMYKKGSKELYTLDQLPVACKAINQLMPPLIDAINASEILKHRLFSLEFLSTLSGEMLVTLIYHRPLDSEWEEAGRALQDKFGIQLIGRSRKQKLCLATDYVTEELSIKGKKYRYRQIEGSFTQPNAFINQQMISWAMEQTGIQKTDLLELYCGNGNFTIPLASQFNRVLATEVSKTSIKALNWNIQANQVTNLECARLAAEEISDALKKVRPFRRLQNIDIDNYRFSHILVDPPRAGLDSKTLSFVQNFDNIIYISCNPESLAENLKQLCQSHKITAAAFFDQFPSTEHMESGVYLQKVSD